MFQSHRAKPRLAVLVALTVLTARTALAETTAVGEGPLESRYALTAWSAETGASPGDVFAITQDRQGYLWLGTQTGLVRFDGFRFVIWADDKGTPVPGPVLAVTGARDGSVWAGGSAGVFRISPTGVHRVSADAGFEGAATALIEDRRGAIWVGNRRGLFVAPCEGHGRPGRFQVVPFEVRGVSAGSATRAGSPAAAA